MSFDYYFCAFNKIAGTVRTTVLSRRGLCDSFRFTKIRNCDYDRGKSVEYHIERRTVVHRRSVGCYRKAEAFIGKVAVADGYSTGGASDILSEENYQEAEQALVKGDMPKDKNEILISQLIYDYIGKNADIEIGSTLDFTAEQKTVPVTLAGIFDAKKVTNGYGTLAMDSTQIYLSRELAQQLFPNIENFDYSWTIVSDPGKEQSVETGLRNVITNHNDISLSTFSEMVEYNEMQNEMMFGGMQALSWLVFLFGVINLINTTLSNQISRKRENSILRSIGLTQKQLCKMNIYEGMCYALFSTVATLSVGLPIAIVICREISKIAFAGKIVPYQFPILEMGLFILVLFRNGTDFVCLDSPQAEKAILDCYKCGRWNNLMDLAEQYGPLHFIIVF